MQRELVFLSKDPLQIFEYWDRIPDGIYEERNGDGWLRRMFTEPVQTRHKKGKTLAIYNGAKGFFSTPEVTFFKEDSKTIKVFEGEKGFFSTPMETYVISMNKIEIYDGDNGFFASPRKVIERKADVDENNGLILLSLLGLVLFGIG